MVLSALPGQFLKAHMLRSECCATNSASVLGHRHIACSALDLKLSFSVEKAGQPMLDSLGMARNSFDAAAQFLDTTIVLWHALASLCDRHVGHEWDYTLAILAQTLTCDQVQLVDEM